MTARKSSRTHDEPERDEPDPQLDVAAPVDVELPEPAPLDGFVRLYHPTLEVSADVPVDAVPVHVARGWQTTTDEGGAT